MKKKAGSKKKKAEEKKPLLVVERSSLVMLADAAMGAEKVRVAAQVRLAHLAKRQRTCPDTEELLERAQDFENWVDKKLAKKTKTHPASHWFTQVKGTGGELIGKVIGNIEAFGRYYEVGDPMIPKEVNRPAVLVGEDEDAKEMVWVEGIERLLTPSKLRKYAGLVPGMKREAGKKLPYNKDLKMVLWRLAGSFLKAQGEYSRFYYDYKERLIARLKEEGVKVIPTPSGRYCVKCDEEVHKRAARFCPECGEKLSLKNEPDGVKYEGHIHMMAMRRMIQLFLDHLWVVWREGMGLSLREPYPIEYLGHKTIISLWDMVDKKSAEKANATESPV